MGSFFSLREANEWEQTVNGMVEPSIWSHASFTPLTRYQKVLFERPGRVEYAFPHGMRQGLDNYCVSEASDVSMLVCFEDKTGRFYSGMLFRAPESQPHVYRRAVEEVALTAPGSKEFSVSSMSATYSAPSADSASMQPEGGNSPGRTALLFMDESQDDSWYNPFRASRDRRMRTGGLLSPEPSTCELDKMWEEGPMRETFWTFLLLYNVREGVLAYFANDLDSCEEVMREIVGAFSVSPPPPKQNTDRPRRMGRGSANPSPLSTAGQAMMKGPGKGTAAAEALAQALRVKFVEFPVGHCFPGLTCRKLADLIKLDLRRRFAIRCEAQEQDESTNCVVFCLRVLLELKLSVRGFSLARVCEENPDIGAKAGEAVAKAWEELWLRSGGTDGFAEAKPRTEEFKADEARHFHLQPAATDQKVERWRPAQPPEKRIPSSWERSEVGAECLARHAQTYRPMPSPTEGLEITESKSGILPVL